MRAGSSDHGSVDGRENRSALVSACYKSSCRELFFDDPGGAGGASAPPCDGSPLFPSRCLVAGFRCGLLDPFRVNGDANVITHHHTAVIKLGVPLHAEVLPVDFRGCRDRHALIAPRILHWNGWP